MRTTRSRATKDNANAAKSNVRPSKQRKLTVTKDTEMNRFGSQDYDLSWIKEGSTDRIKWENAFKSKLYVNFPTEFYDLYGLAKYLSPDTPLDAFYKELGIKLTGGFEFLEKGLESLNSTEMLYLHGRFPTDPPEVVTLIYDDDKHWGYLRDEPLDLPTCVVATEPNHSAKFQIVGKSIFQCLQNIINQKKRDGITNIDRLTVIEQEVEQYITYHKISMVTHESHQKRMKEAVAKSLNGLGIVVPVDKKRQTGYRELPLKGEALQKLLLEISLARSESKTPSSTSHETFMELLTRASIASDECDFGTGLLLGLDLLFMGKHFNKEALQLLNVAYTMLGRSDFIAIIDAQLQVTVKSTQNKPIQIT